MECVPDLAFLQMAAATNSDMFNKMLWHPSGNSGSPAVSTGGTMKQRKTNFTSREVEALLGAVADRKDTVLFGVAGGIGWARAWHEVAQRVSAVEGIHRSESDVRKKWTYLKWEAKNTSKPGRDPTSRAVLDILTSRDRSLEQPNSLLEQLLVPQGSPSSPGPAQSTATPVTIAPKKHSVTTLPQQSPQTVTSSVTSVQQENVRQSLGAQQAALQNQQPLQMQQPPEVCLKWNSYHSNMRATFPSLLNNEQFVDVTLACEGRSIKCHKVMLSACSSYFEELLSQNPCQHPIVFMRDLKFWEVQALVEFMYSGEVNVTQDRLPSLLAAADALQIKGLAGPSSGTSSSTQEDDQLSTGDGDDVSMIHQLHQQALQRRVRKRKSTNPTAYPVRSQCLSQQNQQQQHQLPQSTTISKSQSHHSHQIHHPQNLQQFIQMNRSHQQSTKSSPGGHMTSGYSPPSKLKKEHDDGPCSPLDLANNEPLDLGIDSKHDVSVTNLGNRHKSPAANEREYSHSSGRSEAKTENGVSDEDLNEHDDDEEEDDESYELRQDVQDYRKQQKMEEEEDYEDEEDSRGSSEGTPKKHTDEKL